MKISSGKHLTQSNLLILPLFVEEKTHKQALSYLMPSTKTEIKSHLNKPYFKAKTGQIFTIHPEKEPVDHIILVGLGKEKHAKEDTFRQAVAHGVKKSKQLKATNLSLIISAEKYLQSAVEGAVLGNYNFDKYITNRKNLPPKIESLKIVLQHQNSEVQKSIQNGQALAEEISYIRDLANTPAADCTPEDLAQEGHKIAKISRNVKVTVFNKKQIQKMGLGLLYGVGQGSYNEPRLIVLEYKHKPKNKKPVMLVGKGITFDTGGLNLKPTNYIEDMKMDMTGAATVLAAFRLIARLNPDLHVVGIAACAENNVNNTATKPGDIHTAYNGKTVEITNTDAEGRLVLGDGLAYGVKQYQPEAIIDIATLTGAVIVALGYGITGILGNNQKLIDKFLENAKQAGEKMWQLPLDKELKSKVKGTISDLQNSTSGVRADTIMGALFLSEFVGKTPWLHLDVAGTAWSKNDQHYFSKGATGVTLRTIWKFLENY